MKVKISGRTSSGGTLWLSENGTWVPEERFAASFWLSEAERRLRIINANNRFLDREDRVEAAMKG